LDNPDYTLLEEALKLGGKVQAVGVPWTVEEARPGGAWAGQDGLPLSKAHIRPFVEFRAGASLLRANLGGWSVERKGGAERGAIKGFSDASRRRLMYAIGSIKRDAELPAFITLTYPDQFPDPETSKKHLATFFKRLKRAFPGHGSIWKLEPQERGAPHYHLLTWGCDLQELRDFVPGAWFDIAGGGDNLHLLWHTGQLGNGNVHCVQQVRTFHGVMRYASKYLGKTFEVSGWGDKWTGRYWGIVNRQNILFGELVREEVTEKSALDMMRYQRRFSGLRRFRSNKSLTIFCDADQWINNILRKEDNPASS